MEFVLLAIALIVFLALVPKGGSAGAWPYTGGDPTIDYESDPTDAA